MYLNSTWLPLHLFAGASLKGEEKDAHENFVHSGLSGNVSWTFSHLQRRHQYKRNVTDENSGYIDDDNTVDNMYDEV